MGKSPEILEFEWDKGNLDKSSEKHGVTTKEAEEVFISDDLFIQRDIRHSHKENRYTAVGTTEEGLHLFVVFTMRKEKIRIISARKMHKKEVLKYEKIKKDTIL